MPLPADYIPLVGCNLRCPNDGGAMNYYLSKGYLERLWRHGGKQKLADSKLIEPILLKPVSVFCGLKRKGPEGDNCFCCCGKPTSRFTHSGVEVVSPEGKVFCIYVKPDRGWVVFDWDWRREDPKRVGHPNGWENDFGERICPKTRPN